MNIQYAIAEDKIYVLEANPRASRTVPLVSKVCNIPMARLGHPGAFGQKARRAESQARRNVPHFGVKEAVFPFNMFPEVDPLLGPEMRSTGEVLGMARRSRPGLSTRAQRGHPHQELPTQGAVLVHRH